MYTTSIISITKKPHLAPIVLIQMLPYIFITEEQGFVIENLDIVMETELSGYISTPGYEMDQLVYIRSGQWVVLKNSLSCPSGYVTMISLLQYRPCWDTGRINDNMPTLMISYQNAGEEVEGTDIPCDWNHRYFKSVLNISWFWVRYSGRSDRSQSVAFKFMFSFHPLAHTPIQVQSTNLFSCSVDYFHTFRQHLDCNGVRECEAGEDEGTHCDACKYDENDDFNDCFFCPGGVNASYNGKCYRVEKLQAQAKDFKDFLKIARQACEQRGSRIAVPKTPRDVTSLILALNQSSSQCHNEQHDLSAGRLLTAYLYQLGVFYNNLSVPNVYRQVWVGEDGTVLYNPLVYPDQHLGSMSCLVYKYNLIGAHEVEVQNPCSAKECVICELQLPTQRTQETIKLTKLQIPSLLLETRKRSLAPLTICPGNHLIHDFLQCDPRAHCTQTQFTASCLWGTEPHTSTMSLPLHLKSVVQYVYSSDSVQQFACGNEKTYIHYTLVCDFWPDCKDKSDESFCIHQPCDNAFTCNNGQCVSYHKRGDLVSDCIDDSDEFIKERYTRYSYSYQFATIAMNPPIILQFNRHGHLTKRKLDKAGTCPDTHFGCPGALTACLPVYMRCNGYYDCEGREDENGCEAATCPGFYRCLDSAVCVHPHHICDGWPQCPHRDDEWLCEQSLCPHGCLCHGLAFQCHQPFSVDLYPQLRYLDGSGSGIPPASLQLNVYLIYLVLSGCRLNDTDIMALNSPNLQYLDLTHNSLRALDTNAVVKLMNLKTLLLSQNPLMSVFNKGTLLKQSNLRKIDLSHTKLETFSSEPFKYFTLVKIFNLSYTPLQEFDSAGFIHLQTLVEIDLRHCPIKRFPMNVFHSLTRLEKIDTQNYRLCCQVILPSHLDQHFCSSPQDELSSCDDLMRSELYRVMSWVLCVLSVSGNLFCLAFRACVQRKAAKSAFNLFVSSLGVADLLMGIYMAIIGAFDVSFRGQYVVYDQVWITSNACQAAGFLALLSSEVSALTILLITLDRFIVLRFPFSTVRFSRTSACIASIAIWVVGLVIAAAPVLPVMSQWRFYGQTSTCIPLPVTRREFEGQEYSRGIFVFLNLILFILIAAGQVFVYWSVQKNAMATDTSRKSHELTVARRLITVALTDFLCWFPICLCGILALGDFSIPGEVSVALAMLVLPLNAALNPFLYTFNVIVEKRRKLLEHKLFDKLKFAENQGEG